MDDQEDREKRDRVLLRPWLENLIESGSVPGLEWMDDGKTTFKVPWKHRSKKTWSLRHSSIFLEWAKNTGRWSEGDPEPNYAQLKTRLRCAFNKAPDIEEMREFHRTKVDEPYKVYKFIPRKESKLYPFGRRPLNKTTIPISVRRHRYSITRTASTHVRVSSARRAGLSDSSSFRIMEKKEDVSDSSYKEMMKEENVDETVVNQTSKNWLPDQNQRLAGGPRSAWPLFYDNETKDQINRILPLIVEEANTNSMDMESPIIKKDKEVESKSSSSVFPEITKDQSSVDAPFIGTPKLLNDDPMTKEATRNHEIFSSSSLTSEKLEYLHSWHQDFSLVYANGRFSAHPSTDTIIRDGVHSILPQLNGKIIHSDSVVLGTGREVPACWPRPGPEVKSKRVNHSADHFIQERRPSHSLRDLKSAGHEKLAGHENSAGHEKSNLVSASHLLPLKKLYIASQNAFDMEKSSIGDHFIVQEKHIDAGVKLNVIAHPRVAAAVPCDGKSTPESGHRFATESVLGDVDSFVVKNDADFPELGVIDLSVKVSADEMGSSESRVLDLTKKMVVAPFQRDCRVSVWRNAQKSSFPEIAEDIFENLSDPAATMSERLKFEFEYNQKEQLTIKRTMLLVEKEKELKAREKQLAAREEALFWKETYLHRILSGLDYNGVIPTSRSESMPTFAPSVEARRGSAGPIGSPKRKETCLKNLAPSSLSLFTSQHSSALTPEMVSGRHNLSSLSLTRPRHLDVLRLQICSRDAKDSLLSSTATFASSSENRRYVPIRAAQPVAIEVSKLTSESSLLPSGDQLRYNRSTDLHFEPESDVALGDAYAVRKSYPRTVTKSQPNAVPPPPPPRLFTATNETPVHAVRKRGRPKGSKNRLKLVRATDGASQLVRQMPPLLVIQSSAAKDIPAPNARPFCFVRSENLSEVITDRREDVDSIATYSYKNCEIEPNGCRSYETGGILPSVTPADSGLSFSRLTVSGKPGHAPLTSEPAASNSRPVMHSSLFDHLPDGDAMPETVRQLLASASMPVSIILPPLSPLKSPDDSPGMKVAFIHHHDEKPSGEEKMVTGLC